MTRVVFLSDGRYLKGFDISGHSGAGIAGEDVVCAAISSAAYMAANTITDVCGCTGKIEVQDGHMAVTVDQDDLSRCQDILAGLLLHMQQLKEQYPHHIQVTNLEV